MDVEVPGGGIGNG